MSTVYFCWLCDSEAIPGLEAEHYEDDRMVFFCSPGHQAEYEQLAAL
jgi:hypothetical protein